METPAHMPLIGAMLTRSTGSEDPWRALAAVSSYHRVSPSARGAAADSRLPARRVVFRARRFRVLSQLRRGPGPGASAVIPGRLGGARGTPPARAERKETGPAARSNAQHKEADRRQVTVLFADLSGFTTLSERLDPEEVRAFQNALFESLGQAISPL